MKGKSFYQILGVNIDATPKEIKHAYRVLARKYHPDVSKLRNAETKFKTMGEAYEVLKDPKSRNEYDRQQHSYQQQGHQQSHHQTKHRQNSQSAKDKNTRKSSSRKNNRHAYNQARVNEKQAADLNSFFDNEFGINKKNNDTNKNQNSFDIEGKDIYARVVIDLEHSLNGASQQFNVQIPVYTPQGELMTKQKILNVKIPRGIKEGETIRLSKQGIPGMGAAAGDFLIEVAFNQESAVERTNDT